MQGQCVVGNFRAIGPAHGFSQAESLAWLTEAHTRAEKTRTQKVAEPFDENEFRVDMEKRLARFGCGEDKIAYRGHQLSDCGHTRWSEMSIYRLQDAAEGEGTLARSRAYGELTYELFSRLYSTHATPPPDLVHVTCTGYESPSAAQRLVAARGWGNAVRVTHAYHMGCYAALPALHIASAFSAAHRADDGRAHFTDVVHSELCSLHMNPLLHTPEQLVVQSLFSDGFIAYSVAERTPLPGGAALALLALREEVLPDSSEAMTWVCADSGMQMTLTRDVPELIASALSDFVANLCEQAELTPRECDAAAFAIHPGGPRILDLVQDRLHLSEEQIAFSRGVLFSRGNMSSATLPHIWLELLRPGVLVDGRAVISLAFGPGLTLYGAVLRKVSA